ncbi:hypothetical protein ACHAWF_004563 [Thalassiosira exigua]
MSLHRLQSVLQRRRPSAGQPTQQTEKTHKSQRRGSQRHSKAKNTRRRRIRDLLRHIPTFTLRFLRLMAFVVFLLPAFVVFVWHYLTCDRIAAYYGPYEDCIDEETDDDGDKKNKSKDPFFSRHYLDIYGSRTPSPERTTEKKPVVIFVTGGAWIIGYRMWGALLGRALAPFGVLVIVPDYRNFPRVNIEGMVQDVDMSIQWVFDHVEEYGGDKEKIVLVGQSAGAHIGGVVVSMKVRGWLCGERGEVEGSSPNCTVEGVDNTEGSRQQMLLKSTYSPQELCGFISTSAPHNLVTMRPVFHHHGLSASVQKSIFGGLGDDERCNREEEDVFEKWSPYHLAAKAHSEHRNLLESGSEKCPVELAGIFPRLCVIHGTADKTVPIGEAIGFIALLTKLKIPTKTKLYKGWTHTDPILEAPMRGNHLYHKDIYDCVFSWTGSKSMGSFDEKHPQLQPICPTLLVEAARYCNPF